MTLQFSCGFAIHTKTGSTQAVSGFCFNSCHTIQIRRPPDRVFFVYVKNFDMKKCHVKKSGFFLHDKKNGVVFTSFFYGFF